MIILLYSDRGYEKMVDAFLQSRKYCKKEDITVLYYSVGFDSILDYPNLIKKRWEFDDSKPDLTYYKAEILLDGLNFSDSVCFMDCDIVLGKRFSPEIIENKDLDYPLCCRGPLEFVWIFRHQSDGSTIRIDENNLMDYFGLKNRGTYIWASMISYNQNCRDFLEEWDSMLSNRYLLKNKNHYFPFREETALNVLFWKRNVNNSLGLLFFNTEKFESFLKVESEEGFNKWVGDYDPVIRKTDDIYETCENSSIVQFYHGIKSGPELDRILQWMKENPL